MAGLHIIPLLLAMSVSAVMAQPAHYSINNAHSHNDYQQKNPFWMAYNKGFGSIEADIFLQNDELLVGHEIKDLQPLRTLERLYLTAIQACIKKNKGHVFADSAKQLQVLIDIKTDSINTLKKLIALLQKYPSVIHNRSVKLVITGNRPDESLFTSYPDFVWFDGELSKDYSKGALTKIAMLSDNFRRYSSWNGKGNLPQKEVDALQAVVAKAHGLQKPVRFWSAPDLSNAWYQFMHLEVDYINTDQINLLSSFLSKSSLNR